MNKNRLHEAKHGTGKFDRIKKVVHCTAVKALTQVPQHVEQPAVHRTISLREELWNNGLVL
jgi:hypothetical protein